MRFAYRIDQNSSRFAVPFVSGYPSRRAPRAAPSTVVPGCGRRARARRGCAALHRARRMMMARERVARGGAGGAAGRTPGGSEAGRRTRSAGGAGGAAAARTRACVVVCAGGWAWFRTVVAMSFQDPLMPPRPKRCSPCRVAYAVLSCLLIGTSLVAVHEILRANPSKSWASLSSTRTWDYVCVGWSVAALMAAVPIAKAGLLELRLLRPVRFDLQVHEEERETFSGALGLVMFLVGIADLVQDLLLAREVFVSERPFLFFAVVASTFATIATSLVLGFGALNEIETRVPEASRWMLEHGQMASLVVLASASRVESITVLRTRVCGKTLMSFPMEPKHFLWLQTASAYHLLIEDIPHSLVAMAKIEEAGGKWSLVDMVTLGLGVLSTVQCAVRWLLSLQAWVARRSLPGKDQVPPSLTNIGSTGAPPRFTSENIHASPHRSGRARLHTSAF
eukprot:COSAG02_NODE_261_length_26663_cov_210.330899_15_plen_451_part_00